MTIRRICLLTAAIIVANVAPALAQEWSGQKSVLVDKKVEELMKSRAKPPSVVVGISIGGKPRLMKGYGVSDKNTGETPTEFTHYQIGSLSKQLTAAATLSLMEELNGPFSADGKPAPGKYALNTPITEIFPEASGWMPKGNVRVANLLNMQSGFYNYTKLDPKAPQMPNTKAGISKEDMFKLINLMMNVKPQSFVPGKHYEYSNTNYYLLAEAMERVQKNNYRTILRDRIFTRAGMSLTGYVDEFPAQGGVAKAPYDTTSSNYNKPSWPKGAGEVSSNVADMLKWHAALMSGQIISKGAMKAMFTPAALTAVDKQIYYGMGWFVLSVGDMDYYFHGGSIAGFSSWDGILLNRANGRWVSTVILTNNDDVKLDLISACFAQVAMDGQATLVGLNPIALQFCKGI